MPQKFSPLTECFQSSSAMMHLSKGGIVKYTGVAGAMKENTSAIYYYVVGVGGGG